MPWGPAVPQDYGKQFQKGMSWLTGQYQKPQPAQLGARTQSVYQRAGQPLPPGTTTAPETPADKAAAMRAMIAATKGGEKPAGGEAPSWLGEYGTPPFPTEDPPKGYEWEFSEGAMRWIPVKARGATPTQEKEFGLAESKEKRAEQQQMWERTWMEQERQREASEQARQWEWQQKQFEAEQEYQYQQMEQQRQWQEEQLQWKQQEAEMQQQEMERQERARLSASPISWLQYASYTGDTPAIQPWMMPLMQQQYPSLQTGQAIPGYTPESGSEMPTLTNPSAQLWARMGPTAQGQFLGYRQSRTGSRPEESMFRLGAGAPPGGRNTGLSWTR